MSALHGVFLAGFLYAFAPFGKHVSWKWISYIEPLTFFSVFYHFAFLFHCMRVSPTCSFNLLIAFLSRQHVFNFLYS